jgi:hypothetical protein
MKKFLCLPILCGALVLALGPACPASVAGKDQLEVFSWWTSGGEAVALEALFTAYKDKNFGVEVRNGAITGGGGLAARPVLQIRLAAGNPPDTWQTHSGRELLSQYVQGATASPSPSSTGLKVGTESCPNKCALEIKAAAHLTVLQDMSKVTQCRYQPRLNILGCFALIHAIRSVRLPKPISGSRA